MNRMSSWWIFCAITLWQVCCCLHANRNASPTALCSF